MSLFSPLLIVCFDPDEVPALTELARVLGYPDVHMVTGGMKEAIAALGLRTASPEYVIIDIGNLGNEVLPALDELALHCESQVRVAVIGGINDVTFYRDLRQRGVLEYFTRPVQAADIRPVLMQAAQSQTVGDGPQMQGTVISCMSAASGDGASTLAVNLAFCLAEEFHQPTVLVDMDYQFGLIAKSLDITAPFGIRELFDHPERGLDDLLVSKMLMNYGTSLKIIAAPNDLRLMPNIRPEVIRALVSILRSRFKFVIIDVPNLWTDWTAAALSYSDHTVMVAQLWLRSLTHATRLLAAYRQVGIPQEAVSLVINRSGAKFKEAVTAEDFERICHHKITAYVNNDIKAVATAENQGKTIFETDQATLLRQQFRDFAQSMMVRWQGAEAPRTFKPTGSKRKLLSFLDKKE